MNRLIIEAYFKDRIDERLAVGGIPPKDGVRRYWFIDTESDGPAPGLYSMISLGLVLVEGTEIVEEASVYEQIQPISDQYIPSALAVSGFTREECMAFPSPSAVMGRVLQRVSEWERPGRRNILFSDNPGFDWQFFNYYCHRFGDRNPFGWTARRIGDFAAGLSGKLHDTSSWKRLRKTRHSHNALDDARGNAEAFIELCRKHGVSV